jgi:hypothetical protein
LVVTYLPLTMCPAKRSNSAPKAAKGKGKTLTLTLALSLLVALSLTLTLTLLVALILTLTLTLGKEEKEEKEEVVEVDISHRGELFVALPDGTAQLYHLKGNAEKPLNSPEIDLETSAKKSVETTVQLHNWLGVMQRYAKLPTLTLALSFSLFLPPFVPLCLFSCLFFSLTPIFNPNPNPNPIPRFNVTVDLTENPSPASFVTVSDVLEVGPNIKKEFPVRFISYAEGSMKGTITFTNRDTDEYLCYPFKIKVNPCEVLENIVIDSPIRQTSRYLVTVENPLPVKNVITMGSALKPTEWWTCGSKCVNVVEILRLSGNPEGSFDIQYRPLLPTQQPTVTQLTIITQELGVFKYELTLTTTDSIIMKPLNFEVPLGSAQAEIFKFRVYNSVKCDYACSTKQTDVFSLQKVLSVEPVAGWEGEEVKLSVTFDPSELGTVRDVLTVTSPLGGEYQCAILATCVAPLPQGPIILTRGGGVVEIPFRNCYNNSCAWGFTLDSTAFKLSAAQATVASKASGQCSLSFDPQGDSLLTPGGVITGKLFISCTSKPEVPPWIYYLKGHIGDASAGVKGKK